MSARLLEVLVHTRTQELDLIPCCGSAMPVLLITHFSDSQPALFSFLMLVISATSRFIWIGIV